jgi:DNA polymerase (family 10)
MGARSEEKILKALEAGVGGEPEGRRLLGHGLPAVRRVVEALTAHPAATAVSEAGACAGGARRFETSTSSRRPAIHRRSSRRSARASGCRRSQHAGDTKATVVGHDGLRFDLRVVPDECYGNVLQHFTGSKDHNIALREEAQRRGLSISEYGVTDVESGEVVTHATEDDLYEFLGYRPIPPELREGTAEIAAARAGTLPTLVEPTIFEASCTATRPGRRTGRTRSRRWRSPRSRAGTGSSASPTTRTTSATRGSRRSGGRSPS